MSMENVRKFLEMVKTDEKLARKVVELKDRIKADVKLGEEKEILAEKVVPLARDCNLEFTVDDFIAFANSEVKNLSKEDLLAISGGKISRAPALGLLFAAGLAFAPSAMGNVFNVPLFEHVAEAATTAEDVENELVEYIKEFLKNIDLSNPDDVDALNTFAEGNVSEWLTDKGIKDIKVMHDAKGAKVLHCTKAGETFDINIDALIERAKTLKTAEEVEQELVKSITALFTESGLSAQDDAEAFELLAAGMVQQTLQGKGIEVQADKENPKVFLCTKDGEYFYIDVRTLILRAKIAPLNTAKEIENEITFFVKRFLMDEEKAAQPGYPPKIRPHEIRGEVKAAFVDIVQSVSKKDAGSVVLHCNKNGKAFDIDVNKLISQATKDFFVSDVTIRLKEKWGGMKRIGFSDEAIFNDFKRMTSAWLLQRGIPVEISSTNKINPTDNIIKCYLFEINREDLFNVIVNELRSKPLPKYKPLDHSKDSWEKIVETLLDALNVADFDLNRYPPQDQQAIKNDLQWFAGYIKGSLGRCYCQGWFYKYGSGEPTDKITAQLNVLKAFVEDGYECGANTKQYNIALGHVLRSS